ncbi:hypothetical protein BMC76_RS27135, partial [Escherichia coli]
WKNNISDALVFDYSACYDAEEDSRKPVYANWGSGSNGFAVCDGKAGYGARTEVNRGIREAWSGSKYVAVS